jgi:hypothetical protein
MRKYNIYTYKMQKPALIRTTSVMNSEPVKKTAESVLKSIPESKIKEHDKPFNEVWGFPQDIIKTIQTATRYEVLPSEMKYSSGRDKFVCFFTIRIIRCLPNIWQCNW